MKNKTKNNEITPKTGLKNRLDYHLKNYWKKIIENRYGRFLKWIIWKFSGLFYIWTKIYPPPDPDGNRHPPTFLLWVLSIYIAMAGIASQRYESKLDIIENRVSSIISQLGTANPKKVLELIPRTQQMLLPQKPDIFSPASVIRSMFGRKSTDPETVTILKNIIVSFKNDLSEANFSKTQLYGANFESANLSNAILKNANLQSSILKSASLFGTNIQTTNFRMADLQDVDFRKAEINPLTKFGGANLSGAIFIYGQKCKEGSWGRCLN